jgi:hypothetical protein
MARIKTHVIIAEIEATTIASLDLKAPLGVDVDLETGELKKMVRVVPLGEPVLRKTIIPGKLINEGFLKARLLVEPHNLETIIYLPIFSVTKIDGIDEEDQVVEVSELEHISVCGLPDVIPIGQTGYKVKLLVRALLRVHITVTREEIISLPEEENSRMLGLSSDRDRRSKEATSHRKRPPSRLTGDTWNRYWAPPTRK